MQLDQRSSATGWVAENASAPCAGFDPRRALCYIVTDWLHDPHGTEALTVMVAEEMRRRGWRVRIFTVGYDARTSVWAPRLRDAGIEVTSFRLPLLRGAHLQQRILARHVWRRARRDKPALLFSATNDPLVIHTILSKPPGQAPIFVHDPNEAGSRCPSYHPLWFDAFGGISGLSVHGTLQKAAAVDAHGSRHPLAVVWPASFRPARPPSESCSGGVLRFGQLGRLHPQKGGEFMIAAFSQVLAAGIRAELHFYGDGPDRDRLQALAGSLGVSEAVRFHGRYSWRDLDDIADRIDVAVMPSIYEGFGLVMLEMMSRGRPVISADVGSSREILEGLGGGWVVPRADTHALCQALSECCRHPDGVRERGRRAAQVWLRHFSPEAMVDRYLDFWEACVPGTVSSLRLPPRAC